MGLKSNSAILGGNLGSKPGTNYDAHHIVMAGASDTRMVALRTKMANFKPSIDINSKENGIWLPRTDNDRVINDTSTAHKGHGVHGDDYKQKTYDRLKNKNTRKEFLKELKTIKKELSNGVKFKCKK